MTLSRLFCPDELFTTAVAIVAPSGAETLRFIRRSRIGDVLTMLARPTRNCDEASLVLPFSSWEFYEAINTGRVTRTGGRRRKTGVGDRNERCVSRLASQRRSRVLLQPEKLIASRETRRQRVLCCKGYVGAGMSGCGSRNTIILHASKCTNVGKFSALFNESRDESKSTSPVETPEPVAATNRFDGNGTRSRIPRTARQESLPGSVTAPTNCSTIRISRRVQLRSVWLPRISAN